jgi:hypothetical protein
MQLGHEIQEARETPAHRAIRLLGAKRIAGACDLTTNAVWKWETTGRGLIPARHQATVLDLAGRLGAPFTASEIIGVIA